MFVVVAAAPEVILVNIRADLASLAAAGLLIEAEVNSTVDASIVDVSSYLRELGVVEDNVWNGGVRQGDVMDAAAEDLLGYHPRRVTRGPMG